MRIKTIQSGLAAMFFVAGISCIIGVTDYVAREVITMQESLWCVFFGFVLLVVGCWIGSRK